MTHVAYLKRIVAGARRMWLKTEGHGSSHLSSLEPGHV